MSLGIECKACGTKKKHKNLRYHSITFDPYCENPYVCVEAHPNSPINLITRREQTVLLTYDEAKSRYVAQTTLMDSDRIRRLLSNPLTIRIHDAAMAEFLVDEATRAEQTVSELVRGFIEAVMDKVKPKQTPTPTPTPDVSLSDIVVDADDLTF